MPRPRLWHPVGLQLQCADRCLHALPQDVVQAREDRPGRLLCIGVAVLARLVGWVAMASIGLMVFQWFDRRVGPLGGHLGHDKVDAQRVVQRRDLTKPGLWQLHLCAGWPPC
jgi:hypothetical protein